MAEELNLKVGAAGESSTVVSEENIAAPRGSFGGRQVFSTPAMIQLMEWAAIAAVDSCLPDGYLTVGTAVNVRHLAATPMGMKVTARAELAAIQGRRLIFKVEAHDEKQKIGEGTHERHVVDLAKFLQRSLEKTGE